MVDDDDPKDVPATGDTKPEAPAEQRELDLTEPPEGDETPEGDEAEKQAAPDEPVGELDDDEEEGGDDEGKPRSRAARYRRQADKLRAENEALRNRDAGVSGALPADANVQMAIEARVLQEIGPPPNPDDAKYKENGQTNWIRLERETAAWENDRRAVTRDIKRDLMTRVAREQERVAGLVADHKERVERLRGRVKDFDATMQRATVPVAPHVERLILESSKSDRIAYHLAVDQAKLVKLNNSSPEAVAREIGRIEGRLSLPQAKQQTRARAPMRPLRGGGTSSPEGLAAVNAYIKSKYPPRQR